MKKLNQFILFSFLLATFFSYSQRDRGLLSNNYKPLLSTYKKMDSLQAYTIIQNRLNACVFLTDVNSEIKGIPLNVVLSGDRIEFTLNNNSIVILFPGIVNEEIEEKYINENGEQSTILNLGNKYSFSFSGIINPSRNSFADALYNIQHLFRESKMKSDLQSFNLLAQQYMKSSKKPSITEEQRKLIVQANVYSENKQYNEAIKAIIQANEINQIAWPDAYFNLALLYEQVKNYPLAIFNMKKYLLIMPNAEDARTNQDKIYEWELKL